MEKLYINKTSANNKRFIKFMAFVVLFLGGLINSYSQEKVPFAARTASATPATTIYTIKGDFTMMGNTNLTLQDYSATANNNAAMVYVDIDGDPNTWNSSSATLSFSEENNAIPDCSNIIYAGLYWTGRAGTDEIFTVTNGTDTKEFDKRKVQLKKGITGVYQDVVATTTTDLNKNIYFPSGLDDNIYSAYAEITDYVVANGLGEYFVADIATLEGDGGNSGYYGGWGMVVVYENSKMNWRDVTVFDGHAFVRREGAAGTSTNYTFDIDGFKTSENGYINIKLGVMAGEGDVGVSGDTFGILNRTNSLYESLSHSANTPTNFFNSSINTEGNIRNPDLVNNTGVDIAMFKIDNGSNLEGDLDYNRYITNEQTSTSFQYGTSQDTYVIFNVTFSVDSYVPETEIIVENTSTNTSLVPGQSAGFKIDIKNTGTEATKNTTLTIPIPLSVDPANLTFTESVNPIYSPLVNSSPPTILPATAGNNGTIVWNIGTLPLPNNPDDVIAEINFNYNVTTDCATLNDPDFYPYVTLLGMISGTGETSGEDFDFNLIQGYETNGICEGEPIIAPLEIPINFNNYVNEPPTASNPTSINVECMVDVPAFDITVVTDEADNQGTPIVAFVSDTSDGKSCPEVITRRYSVTDDCDNQILVTQTITVIITTPLLIPDDGANTVDCIANATETFTLPTITDVCGNTLTPSLAVITESPDPLTCEGTRTYTYTYTDCAGNSDTWAYVYTIDTPAFTITDTDGASTVNCIADATETFTLPTVKDVCDNNLSPSAAVITESPDPLTCEGTRTYTYAYTDCAGNSDTWAYVYTIDTPAFTITDTDGASTVNCIADAAETFTLPTVKDVCDNTLSPSAAVITESPDPLTCEGTRTYTYTYTDCAGNSDTWAYVYTIDLTPFILPSNGIETVDNLADATEPTPPSVTDNCGNTITPSAPTVSATPDCQGSIVYTFTYIDCAGNSANWTYTYTIELAPFTVPASDGTTVECIADATAPTPPVVVDANGDDVIPVMTENADPTCEGDKIYTFTYTDCAGNTGVWEYTYAIDVTTLPVVPTNDGSTVECIADATQPTAPVVTDVCGNTITPVITENTDPTCEGDKIYTFTYTDCANNESVYSYTYTIDVTTLPVVPANAGSMVECIADATQPTAPVVTDVCGNAITPVITENTDPTCEGDKIYTFTYTDCANNESVYSYTYTIDVTTLPVVPANAGSTVECIADATQPTAPVVTDVCGNTITPVITENTDPTCEGDKIYTFTYTDCANNESVYSYTYTIDLTPFILPSNGIETVDNLADATEPTPPSVTDNCGNTITPSAPTVSATPDCQGSIVYTFTYIDCAGNSANWTYTYTIELAPFTVPASDGTTVECIADATAPTPPVVVDANGDDVIPVMTENADPICEGDKIYTFTYTDCANNESVYSYTYTIDVTTLPVVPANAGSMVECIADATQPTAPVVTDVCGNAITPVITENTDPTCEGDKIYTFTYTDCANNESVYSYTYTIDVTTLPVVPANAGSTVECIADATQPTAPVVTDVCGNTITPVITENTDPTCEGDKIYTFTYTDCANNESVYSYTYTIDLTPFILPSNGIETVDNLADATEPTPPSVTDNCGNTITPSAPTVSATPDCQGSIVYTFTYIDCAGNSANWTYTYTIELAPFTVPASDGTTVECIADATAPTPPVVVDANGDDVIPVMTENADPTCEGDKIYTFTYTDCANNESVYSYTYTIDVTTLPVVPANAGSMVECIADATQPTAPVVTDVCGNAITPVITENTDPTCEGDKIYTFTYTDCANNESVYSYTYTIDVTTLPVVPANAGSTVECIADATQPTAPVVTDVCGNTITPVITENTDPTCEGDKIYTFTYTDCANNESVYSYTYTIDLTPFILPSNGIETVDNLADATEPTPPSVTDNCGNTITPSAPTVSATPDCQGSIVYTFTYIDCAGNSANWTYTYTIELAPFTVPASDGTTVECIADATAPTPPVVVDANGDDVIPVMTENADPICEGDKIYTFTYTDCAGNTGVWEYTYAIDVTTLPVVPTNDGSTVECIADATQPTAPVVTDVCGNTITPVITENTDPTCEGDKIYTFTYTDCANNESVYSYTYTIDVTTLPVVPANAGSTVECIADATQPTAPVVTDVCGNAITPVITENTDPTCEGDKIYTFTYTDCANNESVYSYTYTIDVTTLPVVPANAGSTVECIADATQPTAPVVTDVCGNTITPVITENTDPTCEGDKIYTFTYTDCAYNESVYIYTYAVKDTIAPELTLPANITAECSDDLTPIAFGTATATDNCDANPIVTFNDVIVDGTCSGNFTITRTWTATDVCGNTVSANQIISTADTTAPDFDQTTLPVDLVVECDGIPAQEIFTATDNCGIATVTVNDVRTDGNCPNNYIITRSYTATDECGVTNTHVQIITVQDSTPPVFVETLPNTNIVVECDAIPLAETLTATDSCDSATVSVSDSRTDGNCPNSYTLVRTWVATDACGLTTTHTQNIIIQDTTPPTFVESLPRDTTVECDAIPDVTSLTATDNCGDAIVTVSDVRTNGNCPSNYSIARTWIATDDCGLTTTHTQVINVQDTTAPVPASTFETTLDVSCTDIPEAPEVEFTDNCSSNVIVVFDETNSFDENVITDYQIIRTWTVRDACNNEEVYTQTLNVSLDEVLNEVVAEDRCFDEGVLNLDNFLADDVFGGTWEIIEGSTIATINGSIFDPTNLDSAYSEEFNPNTDGLQYVLRYTGFQSGCINITDVIMVVDAKCRVLPCGEKDISISTAITPNGDGFNESFDIQGIDLCGFVAEIKIFNRWGALVFESNDYTLGSLKSGSGVFGDWNGSSPRSSIGNNGQLPNGTYYYIINLRNSGLNPLTGPVYLGTK